MTYNYNKIRNKVRDLVKKACYANKNIYTHTVWPYHIIPVVGHSLFLAKKLGADKEAVELAAYLHDYSSLLDHNTAKDHHNHSSLLSFSIKSCSIKTVNTLKFLIFDGFVAQIRLRICDII